MARYVATQLHLRFSPALERCRSRLASERAAERVCLGITERDGDLSNWNPRAIEQLARSLEADFIEKLSERRALGLQSPVQRAAMH